jgi:hypothetical protein
MPTVIQGDTFEAVYESGITGLVGTVAVRIDDNQGATVFGPVTSSIIELGATGVYSRVMTAPGSAGEQFTILWSSDGLFDPKTTSTDELVVVAAVGTIDGYPLVPIEDGLSVGPCQTWTTVEAVAACCGTDSDTTVLEAPLVAASQVLYALSGKQFSGGCQDRVRPCGDNRCYGPWPRVWNPVGWWSWDLGVFGAWPDAARACGCDPLSRVPLAGHATQVLEVTVDGLILDADQYRLDEGRWLTRLPDPADPDTSLYWPSCQNMEADETEDGTFSVLYEFGLIPPVAGQLAAAELACAIHQTCAGGATADTCPLPNGVVRIQRQGITIDMQPFAAWGRNDGVWRTGLPLTDMFLNAYNPNGARRRATVWSPDTPRFPRPQGTVGS